MSLTTMIPAETPFTIPCNIRSEPGWRVLARCGEEVRLVPVIGWRLRPASVSDGMLGLGSSFVLGCAPLVDPTTPEPMNVILIISPDTPDDEVERKLETYRKIYAG